MSNRRRNGIAELGVLLLFTELGRFGFSKIPPVTLVTILGQALLYVNIIQVPWEKEDVCISAYHVIIKRDWRRIFLGAIEHGDDMHLYYNMASMLIKGYSLEKRYGSKNFAFIIFFLTLLTGVVYVALGHYSAHFLSSQHLAKSCAIGFSGVLFALKVLTTHERPFERVTVSGWHMPGKYAAWAELILIHLLVPNSSFIGHLAGILAGLLYCKTYLGKLVDVLIQSVTGDPILHGAMNDEEFNDYMNSQQRQSYSGSSSFGRNQNFYSEGRSSGFYSGGSSYGWNERYTRAY